MSSSLVSVCLCWDTEEINDVVFIRLATPLSSVKKAHLFLPLPLASPSKQVWLDWKTNCLSPFLPFLLWHLILMSPIQFGIESRDTRKDGAILLCQETLYQGNGALPFWCLYQYGTTPIVRKVLKVKYEFNKIIKSSKVVNVLKFTEIAFSKWLISVYCKQ